MKQTIEIEVPDGKTAVWKDGKVVFEDDPKLPDAWEEYCENYDPYSGDPYLAFYLGCDGEDSSNIVDKHLILSINEARRYFAFIRLHKLRDCYRKGWTPSSKLEKRWCITRYDGMIVIDMTLKRESFLLFPTQELAEKFLNNFEGLIEQAGDLI